MKRTLPAVIPEIKWLSPSGYLSLRTCFLRFGLDRLRPAYEQRISNPAAILGTVAHFVVEEIEKLDSSSKQRVDPKKFCEQKWNDEVKRQVELLRNNKYDQHLLKPESWPNYFLQRARTVKTGVALLAVSKMKFGGGKPPVVEATMESAKLRIRGRLDRVEFGADGAHLVDWKSSLHSEDGEVSEQYRCQLLLYAGIYHEQSGVWPTKAQLRTFAGESVEFQIKASEAEALLNEALTLIESYNHAVSTKAQGDLARPSAEACNFCDYRGFCDTYWRNRPVLASLDLEGSVVALCVDLKKDRWSVTIDPMSAGAKALPVELTNLDPIQFFYLAQVKVGQSIRAIRLAQSSVNTNKYFAGPRSYIVAL